MPKPAAVTGSSPRRRWKIAEARSVLAEFAASALSLPEFATQKGIEPQRLRRWQRRIAREKPRRARAALASSAAPAVIELRPSIRPADAIEVVLESGVTLRVGETIDPDRLARLVAALGRGC